MSHSFDFTDIIAQIKARAKKLGFSQIGITNVNDHPLTHAPLDFIQKTYEIPTEVQHELSC